MSDYSTPKINWDMASVPSPGDFNRIEGNIDYLQTELANTETELEGDIGSLQIELQAKVNTKAPIYHANAETTYGAGDAVNYGHVKLSSLNGSTDLVTGDSARRYNYSTAAANVNLNTFTYEGSFTLNNVPTSGFSNFPINWDTGASNTNTAYLEVRRFSTNTDVHQTLYKVNSLQRWVRKLNAGNWSAWTEIDTTAANSVNGVKGHAESAFRTGNVNLTPANIGALSLSGGTVSGTVTVSNGAVTVSNGTVTATSFIATSDKRLKEDIYPIKENISQKLLGLDVKTFRFKSAANEIQVGVIAQEIEELLGEDTSLIVSTGEDGYKKICPDSIFYLLLDLVKKQEKRIAALEFILNGSKNC